MKKMGMPHLSMLLSGDRWARNAGRGTLRAAIELFFPELLHRLRLRRMTVQPTGRRPQIVVSLTAIPPRLKMLHLVIKSIMRQTVPPDRIIVWLSAKHRRKELGELCLSDIPASLRNLQDGGLEIRWTEDIGSYRKLIPTLRLCPDDIILTVDDDVYQRPGSIESLYNAYLQHGDDYVYCRRSHLIERRATEAGELYVADRVKYSSVGNEDTLLPTGAGGVLYPPNIFSEEVFNEQVFLKLVPHEDDCWFTVMRLLNGKKAFQVDARKEFVLLPTFWKASLAGLTKGNDRRIFNQQLTNLIRYYGMSL